MNIRRILLLPVALGALAGMALLALAEPASADGGETTARLVCVNGDCSRSGDTISPEQVQPRRASAPQLASGPRAASGRYGWGQSRWSKNSGLPLWYGGPDVKEKQYSQHDADVVQRIDRKNRCGQDAVNSTVTCDNTAATIIETDSMITGNLPGLSAGIASSSGYRGLTSLADISSDDRCGNRASGSTVDCSNSSDFDADVPFQQHRTQFRSFNYCGNAAYASTVDCPMTERGGGRSGAKALDTVNSQRSAWLPGPSWRNRGPVSIEQEFDQKSVCGNTAEASDVECSSSVSDFRSADASSEDVRIKQDVEQKGVCGNYADASTVSCEHEAEVEASVFRAPYGPAPAPRLTQQRAAP